jgi:hypothetical protein
MLPIEGEHDMWWIIGVLTFCIGGACVAQWREWHVKQSTAGRDVETDYLRQPAIEARQWDEVPGSVMQFAMDEPRPVAIRKMRIRDLPEMFDVVDAEVVPEFKPDRALPSGDPYDAFPELYGPAEMARREMRLRTWAVVHPDEEPPVSSLPVPKVNVIRTVVLPMTREILGAVDHPIRETIEEAEENDRCGKCGSVDHFVEDCPVVEHAGADETWADQLAEIKEQEGRLLPEGVADPEIDEFYASLSADDIEDARWRAEMAEWDRQAERDFRRLDNILEAERQRVIAALTETWGLEFRDECKAIDIRDNELHQRAIAEELAAIANADTLVMA